jgi:uncharacterized protein YbcI
MALGSGVRSVLIRCGGSLAGKGEVMATYAESNLNDRVRGLDRGRTLAAISNELVRLFSKLYGHGPTKARTLLVEDVLVCRMLDPFTTAERTLIERGQTETVQRMRATFHEELRGAFAEVVERHVGRRVTGFIADVEFEANLTALVFFLEPALKPVDG